MSIKADFNGDGFTDILWRGADGSMSIWNIDASGLNILSNPLINIPADLIYRGYGDITGNGTSDMIFQTASNFTQTWSFSTSQEITKVDLEYQPRKQIQDLGDFDGNNHIDLFWYTPPAGFFGGIPGTWTADSAENRPIPPAHLGDFPKTSLDYKLVGTGDFNGDGLDGAMFRGTGNAAARSFLIQEPTGGIPNNNEMSVKTSIFSGPGMDWQIKDLADFNGDSKDDILWEHSSGVHGVWLMNGKDLIGGGMLSVEPGNDWQIKAVQDYNNDGKADLMWNRASDGLTAEWFMDGNNFQSVGLVFYMPGDFWSIVG